MCRYGIKALWPRKGPNVKNDRNPTDNWSEWVSPDSDLLQCESPEANGIHSSLITFPRLLASMNLNRGLSPHDRRVPS